MARRLPQLLTVRTDQWATFSRRGADPQRVRVGECTGGWSLRAAWEDGGTAYAALEDEARLCIIATTDPRVRAELARPFGCPTTLATAELPSFDEPSYDKLLAAREDTLARAVGRRQEPDFAAVADLLPPVLDMTFLGDERASERAIVRADGAIEGYFAAPAAAASATHMRHGLLAGGMNVVCYGWYDTGSGEGCELVAFALADDPSGKLAVYRRVRIVTAAGECVRHRRACTGTTDIGWQFYAALLQAFTRDAAYFARGAQVTVPEPVVQEGVRASLRLGDLTFRGVLPRYGVGQYDQTMHNSFPPAVIFLLWANLEWGRLNRARDLLSHYLGRYVNPDGTLDYYGPAVAEYGQLLAMVARYVTLSRDRTWWDEHAAIVRRLVGRLLDLREQSLVQSAGDERHRGLIPGLPEADYHGDAGEWGKYYFAGDVWVCRGVREVGKVFAGDGATAAEGARLVAIARGYEADIRAAVRAATDTAAKFVPAGPDDPPAFETLTESRHASYCNYRYLLEMVSAGVLPPATIRTIRAYRRSHGGELLGMTRFGDHLDDWPAWHFARGLLDIEDVAGYLMTFYGHLAHHQSRGNWASYEQVEIIPRRAAHRGVSGRAEQVVPCQVMAPIMLKHMLVDESRDAEVLHLLRACPAHWLSAAGGVSLVNAPTRWGAVSLWAGTVAATMSVTFELGAGGEAPAEVRVRLPLGGDKVTTVRLNGRRLAASATGREGVVLRGLAAGRWELTADLAHRM